jgi:hypothetical protein
LIFTSNSHTSENWQLNFQSRYHSWWNPKRIKLRCLSDTRKHLWYPPNTGKNQDLNTFNHFLHQSMFIKWCLTSFRFFWNLMFSTICNGSFIFPTKMSNGHSLYSQYVPQVPNSNTVHPICFAESHLLVNHIPSLKNKTTICLF